MRVLAVEDEPMLLEVISGMLDVLGFEVQCAENAQKALELVEDCTSIDLLITDYRMPGMTGAQLAQEITKRFTNCRVLFTSGDHESLLEQSDLKDGSFNFIGKPFTPKMLSDKIEEILST